MWGVLFLIDILYAIFTFFYEILPAKEEERLTELIVKGTDNNDNSPKSPTKRISLFPQESQIIEDEEV